MARSKDVNATDNLLISFAFCSECEMEHPVDITEFVATENTERIQQREYGEVKTPAGTEIIVVTCTIKNLVLNHDMNAIDNPGGEKIDIEWLTLEQAEARGWNLEGPFSKGEG